MRRQCDCNALGIDLYSVSLEYYDGEAKRQVNLDTRQVEWSTLERAFSDKTDSAFNLHVQSKTKEMDDTTGRQNKQGRLPTSCCKWPG